MDELIIQDESLIDLKDHKSQEIEHVLAKKKSSKHFVKIMKRIKITDFGLSKILTAQDEVVDCCGTPAYVAPEMLNKGDPYHI